MGNYRSNCRTTGGRSWHCTSRSRIVLKSIWGPSFCLTANFRRETLLYQPHTEWLNTAIIINAEVQEEHTFTVIKPCAICFYLISLQGLLQSRFIKSWLGEFSLLDSVDLKHKVSVFKYHYVPGLYAVFMKLGQELPEIKVGFRELIFREVNELTFVSHCRYQAPMLGPL